MTYTADELERDEIEQAWRDRTPEAEVEADIARRGIGVGVLVTTDDGGKGFASQWQYDGQYKPVIAVSGDFYAPADLTPVW